MANTSAQVLTDSFSEILAYNQGSGSVSFYMAHGGTNFGWTAGEIQLSKGLCKSCKCMRLGTYFGWTAGKTQVWALKCIYESWQCMRLVSNLGWTAGKTQVLNK